MRVKLEFEVYDHDKQTIRSVIQEWAQEVARDDFVLMDPSLVIDESLVKEFPMSFEFASPRHNE